MVFSYYFSELNINYEEIREAEIVVPRPMCTRYVCSTKENLELLAESIAASQAKQSFLTPAVYLQFAVSLFNFLIQVNCLYYIIERKYFRKSTFFTILFMLSLSISFRVLFYVVTMVIVAIIDTTNSTSITLFQLSLYVDYCSNFFSLSITFLMSLNRCFCFVSKRWNSIIFDGTNAIIPVVASAVVSIAGAVTCITASDTQRTYLEDVGVTDTGSNKGIKLVINRIFFVFPFGSIACYIVLFFVLHQQNRKILTKTGFRNKGEQKAFVQLLITSVLYGLMSLLHEFIIFVDWSDVAVQLAFISLFNVLNYLPEISLPLLMICSSVQIRKKISVWIAPKNEKTMAAEKTKTATVIL